MAKGKQPDWMTIHDGGRDNGGSSEPPNGGSSLEKRVEKLESTIVEVQISLARIESRLDSIDKNGASKADVEGVNTRIEAMGTKIEAMGRTMIQWAIGSAVAFAGLALIAARLIPSA